MYDCLGTVHIARDKHKWMTYTYTGYQDITNLHFDLVYTYYPSQILYMRKKLQESVTLENLNRKLRVSLVWTKTQIIDLLTDEVLHETTDWLEVQKFLASLAN